MKNRIRAYLAAALLFCAAILSSCGGSGMTEEEIRETYRSLVEASYELNDIYYGDGLEFVENEAMMKYLTGVQENSEGFRVSYMPVADTAPYKTEKEIRAATEDVFSPALCSLMFKLGFEGMSTEEDETVAFARYIEQEDVLTVRVDLKEEALPMGRTYDFENMTLIAEEPSVIRASFPSFVDGEKSVDVRISIIKTANGWRLDSPTY